MLEGGTVALSLSLSLSLSLLADARRWRWCSVLSLSLSLSVSVLSLSLSLPLSLSVSILRDARGWRRSIGPNERDLAIRRTSKVSTFRAEIQDGVCLSVRACVCARDRDISLTRCMQEHISLYLSASASVSVSESLCL